MAITGDHPGDVATTIGKALEPVTVPVHVNPVPRDVIAGPCVLVSMVYATDDVSAIGCPAWSWNARCLVIAADTTGRQLYDIAAEVHHALWAAGIRSVSEPRTYNPDNRAAAGIPALEITAS
jgi:hypothetical protein